MDPFTPYGTLMNGTGEIISDLNLKRLNSENFLNIPDTKTQTQILQSFSFISNMRKFVNMTSTPKGMECLNGIRVLSMSWVILGHIYPFLNFFTSKYAILKCSVLTLDHTWY